MQRTDLDAIFRGFPNAQYWRLFIDYCYWHFNDPEIFDKDKSPGYLNHMTVASLLNFIFVDTPLTYDLISGLHEIAYNKTCKDGGEFNLYAGSGVIPDSFTFLGFLELIEKTRRDATGLYFCFSKCNGKDDIVNLDTTEDANVLAKRLRTKVAEQFALRLYSLLARKATRLEIFKRTQKYIARYHVEINLASTEQAKLFAITRFVQDMHQFHFRNDGNGRTFIYLILQKLLMQNGFLPTIIRRPGCFSGWDVAKLVEEIRNGWTIFKSLTPARPNLASMTAYLYRRSRLDITSLWHLLCRIDAISVLNNAEGLEHAQASRDYLYLNVFYKYEEKEHLDIIFSKVPPPQELLSDLFALGLQNANVNLLNKILDIAAEDFLNAQSDPSWFDEVLDIICQYDAEKILQEYLFHPNVIGRVKEADYREFILYGLNPQAKAYEKYVKDKGIKSIIVLLAAMLDGALFKTLESRVNGINVAQFFALFNPSLFEYCCKRFKATIMSDLLFAKHEKVTDSDIIKMLAATDFSVLMMHAYPLKANGLHTFGVYAARNIKEISEKIHALLP